MRAVDRSSVWPFFHIYVSVPSGLSMAKNMRRWLCRPLSEQDRARENSQVGIASPAWARGTRMLPQMNLPVTSGHN